MKALFYAIMIVLGTSFSAAAACPSSSPSTNNVKLVSGDQRVTGDWLSKTLSGKKSLQKSN